MEDPLSWGFRILNPENLKMENFWGFEDPKSWKFQILKFLGRWILKSLKMAYLQILRIQDPESSGLRILNPQDQGSPILNFVRPSSHAMVTSVMSIEFAKIWTKIWNMKKIKMELIHKKFNDRKKKWKGFYGYHFDVHLHKKTGINNSFSGNFRER